MYWKGFTSSLSQNASSFFATILPTMWGSMGTSNGPPTKNSFMNGLLVETSDFTIVDVDPRVCDGRNARYFGVSFITVPSAKELAVVPWFVQ